MKQKNINLRPNENLYMSVYEDGTVEYIPATPKDHKKEVKRLRNLGVVFATEKRNDLVKWIYLYWVGITKPMLSGIATNM